jgi:phospholipid/cholesterol/gamma-HCH transport system substrate-binding protein
MPAPLLDERPAPFKTAGFVFIVVIAIVLGFIYQLFRGGFTATTPLTLMSPRSGLMVDPGSKVTYNGVEIGKVGGVAQVDVGGVPKAKISIAVQTKYLALIPANVHADVRASTIFGNKYVAFDSPERPVPQAILPSAVIDISSVTTEFNSLFETVLSVAEQVDPLKLNQTLAATAEALDGLGDEFGRSLLAGNDILTDLNSRMPQIRTDTRQLADLTDIYADASGDLFDGLQNAVTTARTLRDHEADLDRALMAAVGSANTGADIFHRAAPYLVRSASDLIPTTETLDYNSPALYCSIRNFSNVEPKFAHALGGNGYSLVGGGSIMGAPNPYVYPDNLPRVNARGGPEGRPGCWQSITPELFPAPFLVMDTGASIAAYNHFELGQPMFNEYVWGRQIGAYTINP